MIDRDGHIIHIDFDFFISNSPGGNYKFERAPFKLTQEYINVLEGTDSGHFKLFNKLMLKGFMAIQKEYKKILVLIEMMLSVNRNLPCFEEKEKIIRDLRIRLFPQIRGQDEELNCLNKRDAQKFVDQ